MGISLIGPIWLLLLLAALVGTIAWCLSSIRYTSNSDVIPLELMPTMPHLHLAKKRLLGLGILACCAALIGCGNPLSTPAPDVTLAPDAKQIQYCRDVMYINPDVAIIPIGYYYQHGFQDDSIAFKFNANAETIEDIFLHEFVPPTELITRKSAHGLDREIGEKWWDPSTKHLIGGNFGVPSPTSKGTRGLNIGILDHGDKSFTVYVYWFEM